MIKNSKEWLIAQETVLLFRGSWPGCGIGQRGMSWGPVTGQVLLPGRNNPLHRSTKGLTHWDAALQGRTSGTWWPPSWPWVSTALLWQRHSKNHGASRLQPFPWGLFPGTLMGTFLWHCLHSTPVLPDTQHLGVLTAVPVTLPDKSIFPCTPEQNIKNTLWPVAAWGCWTQGRAGLMHLLTPVWHCSVLRAGVCTEAVCFPSTLFTLGLLPSTLKYNHWTRQINTVHCPFYCTWRTNHYHCYSTLRQGGLC